MTEIEELFAPRFDGDVGRGIDGGRSLGEEPGRACCFTESAVIECWSGIYEGIAGKYG